MHIVILARYVTYDFRREEVCPSSSPFIARLTQDIETKKNIAKSQNAIEVFFSKWNALHTKFLNLQLL